MYGVTLSILSRFPTPHHQAQQNFNKLLAASREGARALSTSVPSPSPAVTAQAIARNSPGPMCSARPQITKPAISRNLSGRIAVGPRSTQRHPALAAIQRLCVRNPRLTTLPKPQTLLEAPLNFLSFTLT